MRNWQAIAHNQQMTLRVQIDIEHSEGPPAARISRGAEMATTPPGHDGQASRYRAVDSTPGTTEARTWSRSHRTAMSALRPEADIWLAFSRSALWRTGSHQLHKRKPDPKRRAAVIPIFCPDRPIVRLYNGARNGQPHTHAFLLVGEKRFKDHLQFACGNAEAAIRYG